MTTQQDIGAPQDISGALIEYFKSLREEIHIRITEHTRLVWIKVAVLGGVISFLTTESHDLALPSSPTVTVSPVLYLLWIIPLLAVVFDVLIAGNVRVINNLGYYIKNYVERHTLRAVKDDIANVPVCKIRPNERQVVLGALKKATKTATARGKRAVFEQKDCGSVLTKALAREGFKLGPVLRIRNTDDDKEWAIMEVETRFPVVNRFGFLARVFLRISARECEGREFVVKMEGECLNVYGPTFGFWEQIAAQAAPHYHCYTRLDMFVVWLLTVGAWFCSFLLRWNLAKEGFGWPDQVLIVCCGLGTLWALIKLIGSIAMERRF